MPAALASESQPMDAKQSVKLKKPPSMQHIGQPGSNPTSEPVSMVLSLYGYFLDIPGDRTIGYLMSKPTGNLIRGRFKKKNRAQNYECLCPLDDKTNPGTYINCRSVLEYIQFGHTTGQHWCVQSILNCEVLMTSLGHLWQRVASLVGIRTGSHPEPWAIFGQRVASLVGIRTGSHPLESRTRTKSKYILAM